MAEVGRQNIHEYIGIAINILSFHSLRDNLFSFDYMCRLNKLLRRLWKLKLLIVIYTQQDANNSKKNIGIVYSTNWWCMIEI
jgi:hypothetical protein